MKWKSEIEDFRMLLRAGPNITIWIWHFDIIQKDLHFLSLFFFVSFEVINLKIRNPIFRFLIFPKKKLNGNGNILKIEAKLNKASQQTLYVIWQFKTSNILERKLK